MRTLASAPERSHRHVQSQGRAVSGNHAYRDGYPCSAGSEQAPQGGRSTGHEIGALISQNVVILATSGGERTRTADFHVANVE
jgi:hypothetical protein